MLVVVTTHPIQYQVPLWRALVADGRVPFEVWFLTDHGVRVTRDREFGKSFAWDMSPLEGYPHRFLKVNAGWDVNRFAGVRLVESLGPMIRERGVRAVWIQGWQVLAYWQAAWQASAAGAAVWLRGESNDLAPRPAWKRLLRRLALGRLFGRVDHFLSIGSPNRRLYEGFGVPGSRIHDAPYCVDNARFARQAADLRPRRLEIRRSWNIPDDAFCVMFCGKFIPKKRPVDLVEAARRLRSRPEALGSGRWGGTHLLFVGSGELGSDLRAACDIAFDAEHCLPSSIVNPQPSASNPEPRSSFAGFLNQTEIPRAYAAADCLVLPSGHGETWGLVVNEAMASGLPCVVSDACGCAEDLVAPIDPALRYPCGDVDALARAIERVIADRDALAARSREHAKNFDLERTVAAVASLWARGAGCEESNHG